ncbi:MAG: hypothetical protein JXA67_08775 [Micromonosporaceae bacterium]|nr:hypothetical protein [Micromonosporaceae bacterium]
MQPCAVCGGIGIDAGGYCVNCRTYRGVAGRPVSSNYEPTSGEPYNRTSSYPTYPTSGPPSRTSGYTPEQSSYRQEQQTYGGGQQAYGGGQGYGTQPRPPYGTEQPRYRQEPPAPGHDDGYHANTPAPGQLAYPGARPASGPPYSTGGTADSGGYAMRRDLASVERDSGSGRNLPILALMAVVLSIAIGAVIVFQQQDDNDAPLVDPCVVGNWTVTSMTMDVITETFGTIRFTSVGSLGNVGTVTYRADGTAVHTYGDTARLGADVVIGGSSQKVALVISGTGQYDFRTNDSTMTFQNTLTNRKVTLTVEALKISKDIDVEIGVKPARYNCEADTLTLFTDDYRAEAHRDS